MKLNTKMVVLTALTITLLSSGGAFAQGKSGTAGSNRNNAGGGNSQAGAQNGNQGAIASELKWRNAAHASAQAFLNASPNSAVGKLAIYKEATEAAEQAYAVAGVVDPDAYIARDILVIEGEIAAVLTAIGDLDINDPIYDPLSPTFDPTAPTYEEDLGLLGAELAALESELELVEVLVVEDEAIQLVGADTLSDEALTALWELLNK